MRRALICCYLLLFFIQQGSWAQDFDNYRPLRSQGEIPERFLNSAAKKYELGLSQIDPGLKGRRLKIQQQFYASSIYSMDDLLRSGLVLFGTPLNDYVNEVGQRLLKHCPELEGVNVEFYILRSPAVNAFAAGTGLICVNMGLLAQLENEAQLAFILSHELMHVIKQHSMSKYERERAIFNENRRRFVLRKETFDAQLLERSRYSKELEFEADKGGLDIFLKTEYSVKAIQKTFEILNYSHLLHDNRPFDRSYFNSGSCQLPAEIFMSEEELHPVSDWTEEEDSLSTHPSTLKRWKEIEKAATGKESGSKTFMVSQERFDLMRKTARFEQAFYYLNNYRYEDAIYSCFLLRQEEPNSKFLRFLELKAMNALGHRLNYYAEKCLSSYYLEDQSSKDSLAFNKIEGGQQQIYYLTHSLRSYDWAALNMYRAWALKNDYPEDKYILAHYEDAIHLLLQHFPSVVDLPKAMPAAERAKYMQDPRSRPPFRPGSITQDDLPRAFKNLKGPVIFNVYRAKYEYPDLTKDFNLASYILSDFVEDASFIEDYEAEKVKRDKDDNQVAAAYNSKEENSKRIERMMADRKAFKQETLPGLGLDSVLLVDPYIFIQPNFKKNPFRTVTQLEDREKARDAFCAEILEVAEENNLKIKLLDSRYLNRLNIEEFSDIAILKKWLQQRNTFAKRHQPAFNQEEVDRICDRYNIHDILLLGKIETRPSNSKMIWQGAVPLIAGTAAAALGVSQIMKGSENQTTGLILIAGGAVAMTWGQVSLSRDFRKYQSLYYSSVFNSKTAQETKLSFMRLKGMAVSRYNRYNLLNDIRLIRRTKK